jgi:hypothetical protein
MNKFIYLVGFVLCCEFAIAQVGVKEVKHINQTWIGFNSNWFLNKHYFIQADIHFRENDFFATNSFVFARLGLGYQFNPNLHVSTGYAFLESAPINEGLSTRAIEHRIYQQFGFNHQFNNRWVIAQRIRNEQRWQEIIENDVKTGATRFSNRVRYLLGFTIPVFKNPRMPQLVVSDELFLQFGKDIVYNTFDQNRFFVGIKQKIGNSLSFDFGYMNVYQQRSNGYSYIQSNTIRLFLYYNHQPKKNQ